MPRNKTSLLPIAMVASMAISPSINAVDNNPVGVLALYNVEEPTSVNFDDKSASGLGCTVRREGVIVAASGKIAIAAPNYFVQLICDSSILADAHSRSVANRLIEGTKPHALLEGTELDLPTLPNSSKLQERNYFIKVSHFNNRDVSGREADLAELQNHTRSVPDNYTIETSIEVHRASGTPTPDEVVIMFYDSPAHGDRFRQNNATVLKKVGAFNAAHLKDNIYYFGSVKR